MLCSTTDPIVNKPNQNHTDFLSTKDFIVIWALKLYYCKTKYHAVTIVELSNPYEWGDNSIKDHLIRSENCHNILNWIWIWIKVITNFLSIRSWQLNVTSIQNYCCQGLPWVNCKRLALSGNFTVIEGEEGAEFQIHTWKRESIVSLSWQHTVTDIGMKIAFSLRWYLALWANLRTACQNLTKSPPLVSS